MLICCILLHYVQKCEQYVNCPNSCAANIASPFLSAAVKKHYLLHYCCRWRKPKREQLATQQYIDEHRALQTSAAGDDDIVVCQGVGGGKGLTERCENGTLQCISMPGNRDITVTKSDTYSLLCCDSAHYFSDVDETTA